MRKLVYFNILTILIFIVSCESPMNIQIHELDVIIGSNFNRSELKDGGNFSVGYQNGNIQTSKVELSWSQTTEENFIFYKLTRNNNELIVFTDITQTSFIDTLVLEDNYYDYQITVFVKSGMVAKDTIEIKTPKWQSPSNLTANGLNETDVKLMWDDNTDSEDNFVIYFYDSSARSLIDSFVVNANITEKIVTDLDPIETYSFNVKAVNQWEEDTELSTTDYFDMIDFVFYPPSNLTCTQNSDMSIELNWEDNSTLETGFSVERKINNSEFIEIEEIDLINTISHTDIDTTAYEVGDILTYRVRAYNDYEYPTQYTAYSNEFEIVISDFNGINEDFNDGIANNWIDDGTGRWNVINGVYRMDGNDGDDCISYYNEEMTNFTYTADMTKNYGNYSLGLYFRGDGQILYGDLQNCYLFVIDVYYENYSVWKFINGNLNNLIPWTYSGLINPMDEVNNLNVVCDGNQMTFYINNQLVDSITDNTFSSGFAGLYAGDSGYDQNDFDNISLIYETDGSRTGRNIIPKKADKENIYNSEVAR